MKKNFEIQWEKHWENNKISEPSRHLENNPTHAFTPKFSITAPINDRVRKNLEASIIALSRPLLDEEIDSKKLLLFGNGVILRFYL